MLAYLIHSHFGSPLPVRLPSESPHRVALTMWPITDHHDDLPMTHTRPTPSPLPLTHTSQPTMGHWPRHVPPPPPLPPAPSHATLSLAPRPVACPSPLPSTLCRHTPHTQAPAFWAHHRVPTCLHTRTPHVSCMWFAHCARCLVDCAHSIDRGCEWLDFCGDS